MMAVPQEGIAYKNTDGKMVISTDEELEMLKDVGRVCALAMQTMADALEPGITTAELDAIGRKVLEDNGAQSAPEFCYQFPGATCISVNEEVAHGIPGPRIIKAGDLVNIDVSAVKNGFFGDTGSSFAVEPFLSMGAYWAEDGDDDPWTLFSDPSAPTVQYEHTVVATKNGPLVLTLVE